tara:strand:+ start:2159 stop:2611 length:453 start_codon:yes stop_codon:yes gene_type:complete
MARRTVKPAAEETVEEEITEEEITEEEAGTPSENGEKAPRKPRKKSEPVRVYEMVMLSPVNLLDDEGKEVAAYVPTTNEEDEESFTVLAEIDEAVFGQGVAQCKTSLMEFLSEAATRGDDDTVNAFSGKKIAFTRVFETARPRIKASISY